METMKILGDWIKVCAKPLVPPSFHAESGGEPRQMRFSGIPAPLRLPQVLIKPRKTAGVHLWQRERGLLTLVNTCVEIGLCTPYMEGVPPCTVCRNQFPKSIKSTHPPLPIYDTLVTGMGGSG